MSTYKLFKLLAEKKVSVNKNGNINLIKLVTNVIKSKAPVNYIKTVLKGYNKIIVRGVTYVTPDDCLNILRRTNSTVAKEICFKVDKDAYANRNKNVDVDANVDSDVDANVDSDVDANVDSDVDANVDADVDSDTVTDDVDKYTGKTNLIDLDKGIFQIYGHKCWALFFDKKGKNGETERDVYVRGGEICRIIGYTDTTEAIRTNVTADNKISYTDVVKKYPKLARKLPTLHKNTIFINYAGFEMLIVNSNKPAAIKIAEYINIKVLHKVTRKEIDIVADLNTFCKAANIEYIHQKRVKTTLHHYIIDYYLPEYKIAIEIDEFNHRKRNPKKEVEREKYLTKHLGCTFIRCDPDNANFSIIDLIGKIAKIFKSKKSSE